jgi:exopolyphosphatase/guanosine-5'-triphosphate,3'-diphosphate pyrophosphatase
VENLATSDTDWPLVAALRLAALFYRSRSELEPPALEFGGRGRRFDLGVPADWLAVNPLTETALRDEVRQWRGSGGELEIRLLDAHAGAVSSVV